MISVTGRWTSRALALAAGAGAALAHPPFGLLPGMLGYALLLYLVDAPEGARPIRSAFFKGWLCGFAYFIIGCWWIAEAFLVDAKGQGWMAPIALILLPGGLALFWGAACALYRWQRPENGFWRVAAFAGMVSALEWLRGHVLTGFPWNLPGETWAAGSAPSQFASVVGAYGLTWITVAIFAAFAVPFGPLGRRKGFYAVGAAVAAILGLYVFGAIRLANAPGPDPSSPLVRIVQANIPQESKYDAYRFRDIVLRYVTMTAQPTGKRPDIVIWPEGAIPAAVDEYLAPGGWPLAFIQDSLQPGQTLILGGYRIGGTRAEPKYYNSLLALRREQNGLRITGVYDKYRLVPFGEFLPAEPVLAALGLKNLAHVGDGFSHGALPAPLRLAGVPDMQPLICYEVLFPDLVRAAIRRGERPRWIVNISNDAWYGPTSGPWQHLNIASYRAIENGLPMMRATPTGVSAVIDSFGRSEGRQIGLQRKDLLEYNLPYKLRETLYTRFGDTFFAIFLLISSLRLRFAAGWLSPALGRVRSRLPA
ncbi:MAG: apolipoprotein N-acyltransferase [Caulobacteraceae bacterium]